MFSNKKVDNLIFTQNNQPFDPWISFLKPTNFASTCEVEFNLMVELEVKFEIKINDENSFDFHDSSLFHMFLMQRWFVCILC